LPSVVDQLFALQTVDIQLRRLRLELSGLGAAAAELRTEVATKRLLTQTKRQEVSDVDRRRRDLESTLSSEEEKTKDRRMRMQRIRNEKELAALKREIDLSKEQSTLLEEELLAILEGYDAKAAELKAMEDDLASVEAKLVAVEREHGERKVALASDLERLTGERTVLAEKLEPGIRSRYELIFDRKGGIAVVEVNAGDCGGCRMRIAPQLITQIHRNVDIVFCPACQRILYMPGR
jgi:hypothetical protein